MLKLAVTDACIFIDLHELNLTGAFFGLNIEVHTTYEVFNELFIEQQQLLSAFQSVNKLTVHNFKEDELILINSKNYPKSLSQTDKTVLFLSEKLSAIVISSDKALRNNAKERGIEYHGMLWIFYNLIEFNLITKAEALKKLESLIFSNLVYQNNKQLLVEMNKRIKLWSK